MHVSKPYDRLRSRRRTVAVAFAVAATIAVPVLPAGANPNEPPAIASKQAEAARILAQVDRLDADFGQAAEAYNGANLRLRQTTQALAQNTRMLRFARTNLKQARATVAERIVQLYTEGDRPGVVEVVLGASSLDDVVDGLEAEERIVAQDTRIAREVARFDARVRTRQTLLVDQKRTAARLAAETARRKQAIEAKLRERQRLLSSIREEVAQLQAAERARQAELVRQARARLAAQAAAVQSQASPASASALETQPTAATDAPLPPAEQPAPPAPPAAAPPPPSRYGGVVAIAMKYLGIPYKWGGASPATGFDCSGFTLYVYAQIGVSLPHYTGAQWQLGRPVAREDLQPGDLVFFNDLGHEGIYIGANQMIHSPRTGDVVKISALTGWYDQTYMGARRL